MKINTLETNATEMDKDTKEAEKGYGRKSNPTNKLQGTDMGKQEVIGSEEAVELVKIFEDWASVHVGWE